MNPAVTLGAADWLTLFTHFLSLSLLERIRQRALFWLN